MGSTLHRGQTPLWEPSPAAVVEALTSLLRSVRSLQLPDDIGDDHPGDGVEPVALMPDVRLPFGLWTFDLGYDRLLSFLRQTFALTEAKRGTDEAANLVLFPYDWRLSNRFNGGRLRCVAERALERWRDRGGECAEAKLVVIAHSMGGLVARWYIDHLGGAEVTRKLITVATPHRGALSALEQLVNGVRKGVGPAKLNLTRFGRSLPSFHQLLPEYACIAGAAGLSKTSEVTVPELQASMVADALDFHRQIDDARADTASTYELHALCGYRQPTAVSARLQNGRVLPSPTMPDDPLGVDHRGDATVARLASAPPDVATDSAIIHHFANNHGGLVHSQAVFDEIEGTLTASPVRYRGDEADLTVAIDEVLGPTEPLHVRAVLSDPHQIALEVSIADQSVGEIDVVRLVRSEIDYALPGPGLYIVTVRGVGSARHRVTPITTTVLAWPPESAFDPDDLAPLQGTD